MIMDVRGPEPLYESPASMIIPYIIITVLIIAGVALTIYMVKKSKGEKDEKDNK